MLKRKIEDQFVKWKMAARRKPLIVRGVRQCGKTFSVTAFAESNYENVVYINFVKQEGLKLAFKDAKDVDTILMNISAAMRGVKFVPGKTCIILDEIQDRKDARTALKNHNIYHVDSAIKLGDYNVGRSDKLLTIPFYMAFLLNEP